MALLIGAGYPKNLVGFKPQPGGAANESSDGAITVDSLETLNKRGGLKVMVVWVSAASAGQIEVDHAFENTGDRPLRITKLRVMGLDSEGF